MAAEKEIPGIKGIFYNIEITFLPYYYLYFVLIFFQYDWPENKGKYYKICDPIDSHRK